MIERFVDTSGWAELADRTLLFHIPAVAAFDKVWNQGGRLITTNLILIELTALLTSPLRMPKARQIRLVRDLQADSSVEIVFVDAMLESAAWSLWRTRPDKEWSLVDCASFVVMQQRRLTEALSTDHHFEQAGFVRLLK
jgi:uncharacterized protein